MPIVENLKQKALLSFKVSIALYMGLILLLLTKTVELSQAVHPLTLSLIKVAPLILPLWGLLKMQPRAAAWLCFILCFYFISAVLSTWITPDNIHSWLITLCIPSLFISAMLFTRWQGKVLNYQS